MSLSNTEELKKLQDHAYYALLAFDNFARKHDLIYSLAYGTLLGAIRHKGFIPWDDDIDVAMPRDEYEKFLDLAEKDFDNNFFIQNHLTDKNNYHYFTRVCIKGTEAIQKHYKYLDNHKGIFIDVFVFDQMPPKEKQKSHLNKLMFLKRLKRIPSDNPNILDFVVGAISKIFPKKLSFQNINVKMNKLSQKYNGIETNYLYNSGNSTAPDPKTDYLFYSDKIPSESFEKLELRKFKNKYFPVFSNYDKVLKMKYKNYMELPKKEDRQPHHGFERFKFLDDIDSRIKKLERD